MEVLFYYNESDNRTINKNITPSDGVSFVGVPRGDISVMNPVVRFESDEILRFNYAKIPELQRFYYIKDRTIFREGVWDITFDVDVLMSFRNDILHLNAIVDKQSLPQNGDEYIDDGSLVTENVMFQTVYNFPNGFNDTGEYILITAG